MPWLNNVNWIVILIYVRGFFSLHVRRVRGPHTRPYFATKYTQSKPQSTEKVRTHTHWGDQTPRASKNRTRSHICARAIQRGERARVRACSRTFCHIFVLSCLLRCSIRLLYSLAARHWRAARTTRRIVHTANSLFHPRDNSYVEALLALRFCGTRCSISLNTHT